MYIQNPYSYLQYSNVTFTFKNKDTNMMLVNTIFIVKAKETQSIIEHLKSFIFISY